MRYDNGINKEQVSHPAFTGRIVLRLDQRFASELAKLVRSDPSESPLTSLLQVARFLQLGELAEYLDGRGLDARPLLPPEDHDTLADLEDRARNLGILAPVRSLLTYFLMEPDPETDAGSRQRLVAGLRRIRGVEWAEQQPYLRESASTPFIGAVTDDECYVEQGYLDGDGIGINTRNTKVWGAYDGTGVAFGDIERGWQLDHVDLLRATAPHQLPIRFGINSPKATAIDHGTKTIGVVGGQDHPGQGAGIVGIAPAADIRLFSRVTSAAEEWDLTNAIFAAIPDLGFGGILLIETETIKPNNAVSNGLYPSGVDYPVPVENFDEWFDAIRLAVGNGITVIEPAGNGARNLDSIHIDWSGQFESGAVMVSGCYSAKGGTDAVPVHAHYPDCNHGIRVNCYGWGESVYTAWYTNSTTTPAYGDYLGTSAASAMIGGAAVLVQQMYRDGHGGDSLDPLLMRGLLSDPANGTKVTNPGGYDRAMPDLEKIANVLGAWPDIYIRDRVGDDGYVPNALVYSSPDIIVRQTAVADIPGELGPGSPTASTTPAIDLVAPDHDNFVYVRMLNRGIVAASPVVVHVYWSEASPLVPPSDWHTVGDIDAAAALTVPASNLLTVAGPIVWHPATTEVPSTGHGCFIALIGVPGKDPVPPILPDVPPPTWDTFLAYVGANNNVAWRNFNVVGIGGSAAAAAAAGEPFELAQFLIRGARDRPLQFDLAIDVEAHPDVEIRWMMPGSLYQALVAATWCVLPRGGRVTLDAEYQGEEAASLNLRGTACARFEGVRLTGEPSPCRLFVTTPPGSDPIVEVAIRQFFGGREVGRLTRRLQPVSSG